ncbi:ATP-binding cassette domain-containing protein [Solicola gregarius]|uniref:ATP-binding cassette domain-containing protein n=1 Tax=Solicola gregarius TaxID=2908642 RepID=A0AA46TG43_9ACTN|nr:ATP-binding cassette domain-containing protein [Solicola gregarius]UYM04732.1 ATP-binding cassette domain-containing protein [Solicola gregarius]
MNTTTGTRMIETHGLTRHFTSGKRTVEAVRGLDLTVERGELVALLGPNGAGKSTTLRMLTTLISPTEGTAMVAGHDVTGDPRHVRRRIGFIGQGNGAGHQQRGRDELVTQGRAYGLSRSDARVRAGELIESLDLAEVADRKVSTLSGGQRRRLDIAMGLIHAPELLFLDEPSTGLDPQNRANLQEHIVSLRERFGTTVVLTTHYLDEADSLAERIVVVDHGLVVADDTAARLKADLGGDRVTLRFASAEVAGVAAERIGAAEAPARVSRTGERVDVRAEGGPELLARAIGELSSGGIAVQAGEVARPTLDDVFLGLTGRSLREGHSTSETNDSTTDLEEIAA